jgi:dephospho-CoA kinase
VYAEIVTRFGPGIVLAGGALDRPALARVAFEQGRVEELNAIVHPAVLARQEELLRGFAKDAIAVIESALIFETKHGGPNGWRERFDRMLLVTAPEAVKIARFLERSRATAETRDTLAAEARRRLAMQMPDEEKEPFCDYVVRNDGDTAGLEAQVEQVWQDLVRAAKLGN